MQQRIGIMKDHGLRIGGNCFVRRLDESFSGLVMDVREDWVRVFGHGSIDGTHFDEWFPIESIKCWVRAA